VENERTLRVPREDECVIDSDMCKWKSYKLQMIGNFLDNLF
jgi:hypothetical protein